MGLDFRKGLCLYQPLRPAGLKKSKERKNKTMKGLFSQEEPFVAFFIGMGHFPGRNGFHRKEGTT